MWKLCVSYHLGSVRKKHQQNMQYHRGACAACLLQIHPKSAHPALKVSVDNDRVFGCPSRSERISLNYVGLAQTEKFDQKNSEKNRLTCG